MRPKLNWQQRILYSDKRLIVINKPAGLVCQPKGGKRNSTMEDFGDVLKEIQSILKLEHPPLQVHRLDKATTGALLLAVNETSARHITRQIQSGLLSKTYLALVRGKTGANGEITAPLLGRGKQMVVSKDGKEALTKWKLISSSRQVPISLLRLNLVSGLKHQLRVHLASCLHTPILGDALYAPINLPKAISAATSVPLKGGTMFLHASSISIPIYDVDTKRETMLTVGAPVPLPWRKVCTDMGIRFGDEDVWEDVDSHIADESSSI